MAKTQFSITMEYRSAIARADDLDDYVTDLGEQKERLLECRNGIAENWKADSANSYLQKMDLRIEELSRLITNVQNVAATVRSVAENTYRAETEALQLAQQRLLY